MSAPANRIDVNEALLRDLWGQAPTVTTEEMMRRLGCGRSTLQLWARRLGLPRRPSPKRRIGPVYRVPRA